MDRLKWLFTGHLPDTKQGLPKVLPWKSGRPQFIEDNYRDFAKGGYSKNELVFACITELATSVPEAPLRVFNEDDEVLNDHPMRLLIKKPNAFMTEFELWELTIVYLYLAGNAYWEKIRNRAGQVVELFPLRPDRVHIIPSEENFIEGYQLELGGRIFDIKADDIVHFKFPNPLDDFFGMPPTRAGLRAISTDNEATEFSKVILENRAIPGVVITTQERVDDELTNRLTRKWKQKFGGKKRGEPAFLQAGMDIKTLGMTMQDLAFPDLRSISETRICAVYGVPPILVGANTGLQRSTFSNYEEARRSFWQETISPLLRRLSDKVNADLLTEFQGMNLESRFDLSKVTAFTSIVNQRWERADKAVSTGWITVNEARSEVGFDPANNGDVFLRQLSIVGIPKDGTSNTNNDTTDVTEETTQQIQQNTIHNHLDHKHDKCTCGCNDWGRPAQSVRFRNEKRLSLNRKQIELLRQAFGKINFAEKQMDIIEDLARIEFQRESREMNRKINSITKAFDAGTLEEIMRELLILQRAWNVRIRKEFQPTLETLINQAMQSGSDEVGIAFRLNNQPAIDFVNSYVFKFAETMSQTSRNQIRDTILRGQRDGLSIAEQRQTLNTLFDSWSQNRALQVARSETIRASNRGAQFVYKQSGIQRMEWLSSDDACVYCEELDGKIVSVAESFVELGGQVEVAEEIPLSTNYEDVDTPPLHPNCRCTVIPVIE